MCYDCPPPCFEYVDLWQYSDDEIIEYIHELTEYILNKKKWKEKLNQLPEKASFNCFDDIPF